MVLTAFQRWVVAVAAVLVALRMLFPVTVASRLGPPFHHPDVSVTLLHVGGILVVAAALFFLTPTLSREVVWWTKLGLVLVISVAVLALVRAVQVEHSRQERVRLQQLKFPTPSGLVIVNDVAGVLNASAKAQLEARLQAYERETNTEMAIAILPSLGGRTIEDLAVSLFEQWGIGKRTANNGILIVAAIQDRRVRIEVGYGLEGKIPDAQASRIIRDLIAPKFHQGDYAGGLEAAIDELSRLTGGTGRSAQPSSPPSPRYLDPEKCAAAQRRVTAAREVGTSPDPWDEFRLKWMCPSSGR